MTKFVGRNFMILTVCGYNNLKIDEINRDVCTTHDDILQIKDKVSPHIFVRPFYM